jgi:Flp pilus assembly protein TadD
VNLAVLLAESGDPVAGEARAREALALRPGHPPARFNLAFCLMRQGRTGETLGLLDALAADPATPEEIAGRARAGAANLRSRKGN